MAASIEKLIESSACYGHLYEGDCEECQRCEAWLACERSCKAGSPAGNSGAREKADLCP